jgi:endogenous inhibitor of DNA gyrase (YacG/DUF329 family)
MKFNPRFDIICDTCNKRFHKKPSRIGKHNFCSRECYFQYKRRNQIITSCERCGKEVIKSPSKATDRGFCSPQCLMKTLNEELNPTRMTAEVKAKLRKSRLGKGEGKTYEKTYQRHTHRIVAEKKLGRPLKPGEVVHHIDRDKRNNHPENLMVFPSQKEHAKWHRANDSKYGGDQFHG